MQDVPKPSFIIIGSAKCGTTTLAKVLSDHPHCCFSCPKEVCFFCSDKMTAQGWQWYAKHFFHYAGEAVTGEATPAYADRVLHPNTAKRIFEFDPDMKLIYIVRDPYERYVSGWKMHYRTGKVNARDGINAYFERSPRREADVKACCYSFQLQDYLQHFPKESIHVAFLEDFSRDPLSEMKRICRFINIDPDKVVVQNKSGENKGDTYRKTSKIGLWLSKLGLTTVSRLFAPAGMRRRIFNRLFVTKVASRREDLSAENMQIFKDIVEADARAFLKSHGKPADFWKIGADVDSRAQGRTAGNQRTDSGAAAMAT